jgi:hypothetical protein
MRRLSILFLMLLMLSGSASAQRARQTSKNRPSGKLQDIPIPAVTMRGSLREINKKQILMDAGDDQIVTFRRVKKTKFLKGAKDIPEAQLQPGAAITVEATREPDGEFDALNVYLGEPPPESAR